MAVQHSLEQIVGWPAASDGQVVATETAPPEKIGSVVYQTVGATVAGLSFVLIVVTLATGIQGAGAERVVAGAALGVCSLVLGDIIIAYGSVFGTQRRAVLSPAGLIVSTGRADHPTLPSAGTRVQFRSPILRIPVVRFPSPGPHLRDLEIVAHPSRSPYEGTVSFRVSVRNGLTRGTLFRHGLRFGLSTEQFAGLAAAALAEGAVVSLSTLGVPRVRIASVATAGQNQPRKGQLELVPGLGPTQVRAVAEMLWVDH